MFLGLRALFRTQIYIFLVFELVGFYYTHIAGIGYTTKQEAVDKSLNLGHLTIRQLTVAMSVNNTPTHSVGYTEALPNLTGCLCRRQHSLISQPFVVGITQQQKGTRKDKCTQLVLVVGQTIDGIAVEVLELTLLKPVIVCSVQALHLIQGM